MSIAESFGKSGFAKFINSPAGRIARIVVGLAVDPDHAGQAMGLAGPVDGVLIA